MKKLLAFILALLCLGSTAFAQNDTIDMLINGKTTQAFSDAEVSQEDLDTILYAGINAQSAMNSQPWHFSVIAGEELLNEFAGSMTPPVGQAPAASQSDADASKNAPPAVASSGAKASMKDAAVAIVISCTSTLKWNSFDSGAACERMAIAARVLGYGTKVVASPCDAINADEQLKSRCGISDNRTAIAVLLIGKTDESVDGATGATTRNAADEVVTVVK